MKVQTDLRAGTGGCGGGGIGIGLSLKLGIFLGGLFGCGGGCN